MSSDTSSKALMAAISAGGLYMLGQTAFRYGAHRLGSLFLGGTFIGLTISSLLLLHDFLSCSAPSSASVQSRDGSEMKDVPTCLICQSSTSDISCKSDPSDYVCHSFCKVCFNVYANQGLLDGGYFEQYETSPSGHISRPGELPCPMFSQGCMCASLPLSLLRIHLTPHNNELLNDATKRIALQLSLSSLMTGNDQGIRLRFVS